MIYLDRKRLFQVMVIFLLLISLPLSLLLLTKPVLFKTKAAEEVYNAFEIRDNEGNLLTCSELGCNTSTLNINIKLRDTDFFSQQK